MDITRRSLIGSGTALAALGLGGQAVAAVSGEVSIAGMIVIDGNSTVMEAGIPLVPKGPLSSRAIEAIKASGLTAVVMTIGQGSEGDRFGTVVSKMAGYAELISGLPDLLLRVRTSADILRAKTEGKLGIIYTIQDTMLLDTDVQRLGILHGMGLRIVQLTYNRRNLVGDGSLEANDGGLSSFGYSVVEELNRKRMVVDLSHGGAKLIRQAIAASKAPPIISHSGCRAITDLPRNVHDLEMRQLADKGGVFGIYFMPFLTLRPPAKSEDVIRHIEHALKVCGEDHISIGSDGGIPAVEVNESARALYRQEYERRVRAGVAAPGETPDGEYFVPDYNQPDRMFRLASDLSRRGWPTRRIEKLFGANLMRVFSEVWG